MDLRDTSRVQTPPCRAVPDGRKARSTYRRVGLEIVAKNNGEEYRLSSRRTPRFRWLICACLASSFFFLASFSIIFFARYPSFPPKQRVSSRCWADGTTCSGSSGGRGCFWLRRSATHPRCRARVRKNNQSWHTGDGPNHRSCCCNRNEMMSQRTRDGRRLLVGASSGSRNCDFVGMWSGTRLPPKYLLLDRSVVGLRV